MKFFLSIFVLLSVLFLQACSNNNKIVELTSIEVNQTHSTLATSSELQLNAMGNYNDGSTKNINNELLWLSSDSNVSTVENGLIRSFTQEGNVTISYRTADMLPSGEAVFKSDLNYEVKIGTLESITIEPDNPDIYIDANYTLSAIGYYDINATHDISKSCNWSSVDETIAIVIGNGIVKGISEGVVEIVASEPNSGLSDVVSVNIKVASFTDINISTPSDTFNVGETLQFKAFGTNNNNEIIDITQEVTWSSDDSVVADINSNGLATAKTVGDVKIKAELYNGKVYSSLYDLKVWKSEYIQLSSTNEKLAFPYLCQPNMPCLSYVEELTSTGDITIASYTIKAIGKDFVIKNLKVTDFEDNNITDGSAKFIGLAQSQVLTKDEAVNFSLVSTQSVVEKELKYSFFIDNENDESFISSYRFITK